MSNDLILSLLCGYLLVSLIMMYLVEREIRELKKHLTECTNSYDKLLAKLDVDQFLIRSFSDKPE